MLGAVRRSLPRAPREGREVKLVETGVAIEMEKHEDGYRWRLVPAPQCGMSGFVKFVSRMNAGTRSLLSSRKEKPMEKPDSLGRKMSIQVATKCRDKVWGCQGVRLWYRVLDVATVHAVHRIRDQIEDQVLDQTGQEEDEQVSE